MELSNVAKTRCKGRLKASFFNLGFKDLNIVGKVIGQGAEELPA